jgi:protease I
MRDITGKKILILATNGFEQSELEVPRDRLKAAGATVTIASPEAGEIKGWDKKNWGRAVKVTSRSPRCAPPTTTPSSSPAAR